MSADLQFVTNAIRADPSKEKLFNWNEISKTPLTDEFIEEHQKSLMWDIMSQHQSFSLNIVNKFEHLINFNYMAKNPHLTEEVLLHKSDKMDWETLQVHQKLSRPVLQKFRAQVEPMMVLRHQKLDEDYILGLLEPVMEKRQLAMVKAMLDTTLQYQRVSQDFVLRMLAYEDNINPRPDPPPLTEGAEQKPLLPAPVPAARQVPRVTLVNLVLIAQYQTVDEAFVTKFLMRPDLLPVVCQHQKLSASFLLKEICENNDLVYKLGHKIVQYQVLTNDVIRHPNLWRFISGKMDNIELFLKYQHYSLETFKELVATISGQDPESVKNRQRLYNIVVLRASHSVVIGNPRTLFWPEEHITEELLPHVDFELLVSDSTHPLTPEDLKIVLDRFSDRIPWYITIKYNTLTEEQILKASAEKRMGAIHWWLALTNSRPKNAQFSAAFVKEHAEKKNWWKYLPTDQVKTFYEACIEVIQMGPSYDKALNNPSRNNIRTFLKDFVEKADWGYILRYHQLDEWFIRIFSHFANRIDKYWWKICRYQKLNESFIRANLDKVDLIILISNQKLSMSLLEEIVPFLDATGWEYVTKFQDLTPEFKQKYLAK